MEFLNYDFDEPAPKQRHHLATSYVPVNRTPNWFENYSGNMKLESSFRQHEIEYAYYLKDYSKCLLLCRMHLDTSKLKYNICEIMARCSLQLNQVDLEVCDLVKNNCTDVSSFLLLGKLYEILNKYELSLQFYQKYLSSRSSDYLAWKRISECFKKAGFELLSIQCLAHSLYLYEASRHTGSPFRELGLKHEISEMKRSLNEYGNAAEISRSDLQIFCEYLQIKNDSLDWIFDEVSWKKIVEEGEAEE